MAARLIVNPNASLVTPELVSEVEAALAPVETVVSERRGHASTLAEESSRGCERIYVLAGDGGFNEAVNGMNGGVPVGFIPGGGSSVLPRALGLPRDPVECARALARSHAVRRISLGRANGRRFTFSAGLGLAAETVRAVDRAGRRDGRRPGDVAFVRALLRIVVARGGRFGPQMTVLGRGRVAFALVANCDPFTYVSRFPVHVAPEADFELGLDLVAPERVRASDWPRLLASVLAHGTHTRDARIHHLHDVDEIRIECDAPAALQVDGEDLGDVATAVFEAERAALPVLVSGTTSRV
ncbi:MAG: hypothetical protein M3312_02475 [Actinomycetota bacterium]|nr:hypothetical protein [Actinomycetota bacterium]